MGKVKKVTEFVNGSKRKKSVDRGYPAVSAKREIDREAKSIAKKRGGKKEESS